MNAEQITAAEYLALRRAGTTGAKARLAFNQLEDLRRLPKMRERLAFEFIEMAVKEMEKGVPPIEFVGLSRHFMEAVCSSRHSDYRALLEKVVFGCFHRAGSPEPRDDSDCDSHFFALSMGSTLFALRSLDAGALAAVILDLKSKCVGETDPRWEELVEAELSEFERREKMKRLTKEVKLAQLEKERIVSSFHN